MTTNNDSLPPYYDVNSWLSTYQTVDEYSKIYDTNHISCCKQDIKHDDKLLLLEFIVLKQQIIAHDLHIIRIVKDGTILCKNPSYIYVESKENTKGIITKRITSHSYSMPNGQMIDGPLYEPFESYPTINRRVSLYAVRLHSDDLLNDIKNKKQTPIPSLFRLCVSAIATNCLEQYNDMNHTMHLSLK